MQKWNPNFSVSPVIGSDITVTSLTKTETTDYIGNIIYESHSDGTSKTRILVDGGYIDGGIYYFYLTDHLGNNRVVANASGTIIQKNHYYPFGMAFAETPLAEQKLQPYKYNNKEFDQMHGLNWYDYSARYYDATLPILPTPDPMSEKFYNTSPYAYCANNPVKYIDPTGMSYTYNWETGDYEYTDKNGKTKTVSYDEVISKSDVKSYDITTKQGQDSFKKDYSLGGLVDQIGNAVMSLFAITENKVTPQGDTYTSYTPRTYENSGPDYLGGNISGALPNGLLFMTNTEIELNVGYLKKDGWVLFPTVKEGTGFNLSLGVQGTAGWYIGGEKANAKSLEGSGIYTNYSKGRLSTGYSIGLDSQNRPSWHFISVGVGVSIPKSWKWSTQTGASNTGSVHYFRNFNWSNK